MLKMKDEVERERQEKWEWGLTITRRARKRAGVAEELKSTRLALKLAP